MLVSPNQIKAGRALIDWSAEELAKRAGATKATISAIETGKSAGSVELLSRIVYALQAGGVEFTDAGGVQPRQSKIVTYRGHEGFKAFFDDVYEIAKTSENPDICITNVNEAQYEHWLGSYEPIHVKRMAALAGSAKLRVLVRENDTHLTSTAYCEYRWVPKEDFADVSLYLYGDKSALIEFTERDVHVTLVENKAVTNSLRKMFELGWSDAKTGLDA